MKKKHPQRFGMSEPPRKRQVDQQAKAKDMDENAAVRGEELNPMNYAKVFPDKMVVHRPVGKGLKEGKGAFFEVFENKCFAKNQEKEAHKKSMDDTI